MNNGAIKTEFNILRIITILGVGLIIVIVLLFKYIPQPVSNEADNFMEFIVNNKTDDSFIFSSGYDIKNFNRLVKENASLPRVILSSAVKQANEWYLIDKDIMKNDLRYIGDLASSFTKYHKWDIDYYLYIKVIIPDESCMIIYDYERDILYIPKDYERIIDKYNRYGTFDFNKYTTKRRISTEQITEYKEKYDFDIKNYEVNINLFGKFTESNKEDSIMY